MVPVVCRQFHRQSDLPDADDSTSMWKGQRSEGSSLCPVSKQLQDDAGGCSGPLSVRCLPDAASISLDCSSAPGAKLGAHQRGSD